MNNEEKIIEMLTGMQQQMDGMQQQMDAKFDAIDARFDKIEKRLDKVETDVLGVRVLVDVDIDKKLKALAEGQEAILNELERKTPIRRTEDLEQKQTVMSYVVKNLVSDVEQLKQAQ